MDAHLAQLLALWLGLFLGAAGLGILAGAPTSTDRLETAAVPESLWPAFGWVAIAAACGLVFGAVVGGVEVVLLSAGIAASWYVVVASHEIGVRGRPSGTAIVHGLVAFTLLVVSLRAWLQVV